MPLLVIVRRATVAAIALLLLTAGVAQAATYYAKPTGGATSGTCSSSQPCTLAYGLTQAFNGDTLILDSGTYTTAGNLTVQSGATVDGFGAGYTTIVGSNTGTTPVLVLGQSATLREVSVIAAAGRGVSFGYYTTGDRIDVRADGVACFINGQDIAITSSLCDQTSTSASSGGLGGSPLTAPGALTLRNDTIVGNTVALSFQTTNNNVAQDLDLINTVAYARNAGPSDCPIFLQPPTTNGSLNFSSTQSNHVNVAIGTACASFGGGSRFTVTQTSRQATPPTFVNPVADPATADYRPTAASVTRAAGVVDAANGALDLAFAPRVMANQTDIGAYQYIQPSTNTAVAPTDITPTAATLRATVNNHGLASSSSFSYGIAGDNEVLPDAINLPDLLTDQPVSLPLTGLTPGTTYVYDFCTLTLSFNPCLGDQTFTTLPTAPVVSGGAATNVTQTTATLAATVNPGNGTTGVHFEYGPTDALGTSTATATIAKGTTDQSAGAALSGLAPGTTYRVRAVAANDGGTTRGDAFSFTTAAATPTPNGGGSGSNGGGSNGGGGSQGGGGTTPAAQFAIVGRPKVKKGVVTLTVRTPAAGKVRAKATVKVGKKTLTYATTSTKAKAAATVKLTLKPGRKAKAARTKARRLSAKLAATFTPATGRATTLRTTVPVK